MPALTGFGLAEFVTLRSACVPEATAICKVAELLAGFESRELEDEVIVSVINVPAATPRLTL